jgi:hypothetical protein
MEIIIGFSILLGMFLLGKFFDKKTNELNSIKEETSFIKSISEDPTKIVYFIHQDLNAITLSPRERRFAENAAIISKYLNEMHLLCQCAQFLAIDQNVVNLQLRGPLISNFKKINMTKYEIRYSSYRDAYLNNPNAVAIEFLKSIDLTGAKAIAIDPTYAINRFHTVYESARKALTKAGMIAA